MSWVKAGLSRTDADRRDAALLVSASICRGFGLPGEVSTAPADRLPHNLGGGPAGAR
jgi:hypothetical protein